MNVMFDRESWHLRDHVPILRKLRWGAVPFANLRFLNGPEDRLPWRCGKHYNDKIFQRFTSVRFDCDWEGNALRPHQIEPRFRSQVTGMNRDEWYDSVELLTVSKELQVMWVTCVQSLMGLTAELTYGQHGLAFHFQGRMLLNPVRHVSSSACSTAPHRCHAKLIIMLACCCGLKMMQNLHASLHAQQGSVIAG